MTALETKLQPLTRAEVFFDPEEYLSRIYFARDFIREKLPKGFVPQVTLTLGSGGLGEVAGIIDRLATIPYGNIPGFKKTTVLGHEGNLVAGYIEEVPIIGFQGRNHYYETGGQPNQVSALKEITFPVYVARLLGATTYFATNAAGGLNLKYKPGDLMVINSHVDILFPNPLSGPQVNLNNPLRFQPQNGEYNPKLRALLHHAAVKTQETQHIWDGVYCAVTGPTYESRADSLMLRKLGADAVGMSTVPEVIVATNLGMETVGFSLITNVVAADGTNATSHEEVSAALQNPVTKKRLLNITQEFFRLFKLSQLKR
jgi:purine-nucleoside phosphorylase